MKLLKSKFITAFVLAGVMFSLLSFSTAPVVAQDTTSSLTAEYDQEVAALPAVVIFVLRVAAWSAGFELGTRLIGNFAEESEYPADALDGGGY